jgi:hypothetical protein
VQLDLTTPERALVLEGFSIGGTEPGILEDKTTRHVGEVRIISDHKRATSRQANISDICPLFKIN